MTLEYPRESVSVHPPLLYEGYRSTIKRAPKRPLVIMPHTLSELTGPVYGHEAVAEGDNDLTKQQQGRAARRAHRRAWPRARRGWPAGAGYACSKSGRPMPAGVTSTSSISIRRRSIRISPAPAAPPTDKDGHYKFITVKPGRLSLGQPRTMPGGRRIFTSRSSARHFSPALVTQMYFPGDPLFEFDPIFHSVRTRRRVRA